MTKAHLGLLLRLCLALLLTGSCASTTLSPVPTQTSTTTPSPTLTLTPTPTPTLVSSATPTSTPTPVPTPTPSSTPRPTATPTFWDTRVSAPEQQGVNSELLIRVLNYIEREDIGANSVVVIRNGQLVMEAYFYPFRRNARHNIYSCTKSFTSALLGIAIADGYIDELDHQVLDFFPERTFEYYWTQTTTIPCRVRTMRRPLCCRPLPPVLLGRPAVR